MKNIEGIRKYLNELRETLYLSIIPGFIDNINNIRKTENWDEAKNFNEDEEW